MQSVFRTLLLIKIALAQISLICYLRKDKLYCRDNRWYRLKC